MAKDTLLPALRADLELTIAPSDDSGTPVWMLHDPVHESFTRIDWIQFEIIKRLDEPQTFDELIYRLNTETAIREDDTEVREFIEDLISNDLTTLTLHKNSSRLEKEHELKKSGIFKWLIFHYLYFRLPLIHPDKFLTSTLGLFRILSSKSFIFFYTIICLLGLFFLSHRFDEYIHTFTNFLNPKGIFIYGISIAALKVLHEFSHAYTAKYYGNRVPSMGLAFIVLWPIPYCDVTDSWRMDSRHKRLRISAAGVITELIVAGFALFIWGISTNTHLKSITFVLSSISLLSTLLVNLNPLMRFDGYYIFSDLTGIDNLQNRAFAMTRWFYRKALLGINSVCPESNLKRKQLVFMVVYSVSTWIYRLFLYTGIAVLVYYTFPKVIGIMMFGIEIYIFLLRPIYNELTTDYKLILGKKTSPRLIVFILILCGIITWASIPVSRYTSIPAITTTDEMQIIYSPQSGIITYQNINRGSKVMKNDELVRIDSEELNANIKIAKLKIIQIANDIQQISSQAKLKGLVPQLKETYLQSKAELRALIKLTNQNVIYAGISGVVTDYKDTLKEGLAVFRGEELGRIYNLQNTNVRAYTTPQEAEALKVGDIIDYIPSYSTYSNERYRVRITKINHNSIESLTHLELSSLHGGEIDVIQTKDGDLQTISPYYEIECTFIDSETDIRLDQPGRVIYWSNPRSYLTDFITHVYQVLVRESGI